MHNFDLGMSKELKNCLFKRLGSENLTVKDGERKGRAFKSMRTPILRAVNEMLKEIQVQSYVTGVHVDFSCTSCSSSLNGLFTSDGLCGMMEAKNMRSVDYGFPFICVFIDRIFAETWGPLTSVSTIYIEIIHWILERNECTPWTEKELDKLRNLLFHFQELVMTVFSKYQTSNFKTLKFHF